MEHLDEIWQSIPGYEPYKASNKGNIISKDGLKIKSTYLSPIGYKTINLSFTGTNKTVQVHRLIALAFIPNPENKACVNHKNGIKTDNSICNLEWATHSENNSHAYKIGLRQPGNRKLNPIEVIAIRDSFKAGFSVIMIANYLRMSRQYITKIITGKRWLQIPL